MKISKRFSLVGLVLFISLNIEAQGNKQEALNKMIITGMQDWKVPGLAAVVVKNGEVVFKNVYGVKNLQTREQVDENTLFGMASTTKAITGMALGILVDKGKLNWDDKVKKHLPDFRLSDPYIAEELRIQDLLTHNSGINSADLLWLFDPLSTKETIDHFELAKKVDPIRGGFHYNNLMYAIAGQVVKEVSGQPWSDFVEQEILTPLEMANTKTGEKQVLQYENRITPYRNDLEAGIINVNLTFLDQIGAAGSMWSTANDISHYLEFLVNDGVYKGDTIIQPKTFQYLFEPHAIIPFYMYPVQNLIQPNWNTYSIGWFQEDYRGEKLDFHSGSLDGFVAIAGVLHDKNVAVYVFANMDHAELRHAILLKAMDLYAFDDLNGRNWHQEIFELYDNKREKVLEKINKFKANRKENTSPSLALEKYAGKYHNDMLGEIEVTTKKDSLKVNINDYLNLQVGHWHYNTFDSDMNNRAKRRFFVNFNLDGFGKIEELEIFGRPFRKLE